MQKEIETYENLELVLDIGSRGGNIQRVVAQRSVESINRAIAGLEGLEDKLKTFVSLKRPQEHASETIRSNYSKILDLLPHLENGDGVDYHEAKASISRGQINEEGVDKRVIDALFNGEESVQVNIYMSKNHLRLEKEAEDFGTVNFGTSSSENVTVYGFSELRDKGDDLEGAELFRIGQNVKRANALINIAAAVTESAIEQGVLETCTMRWQPNVWSRTITGKEGSRVVEAYNPYVPAHRRKHPELSFRD